MSQYDCSQRGDATTPLINQFESLQRLLAEKGEQLSALRAEVERLTAHDIRSLELLAGATDRMTGDGFAFDLKQDIRRHLEDPEYYKHVDTIARLKEEWKVAESDLGITMEHCSKLMHERDALKRENAAETERLDWILAFLSKHQHFLPDEMRRHPGKSLREALDAAIKGTESA